MSAPPGPPIDAHRAAGLPAQPARSQIAGAGERLASQLPSGAHPVVLTGSPGAGRSTLLASLLAYLRSHGGMQVEWGPWTADAEGCEPSMRFFRSGIDGIVQAPAPGEDAAGALRVVPVTLRPGRALPDAGLVFIDSRGGAEAETSEDCVGGPREALSGFLLAYPQAISFLHLAPLTRVATWTGASDDERMRDARLLREADAALARMLDAYRTVRVARHRDSHLLLATKWDACAAPGLPHGRFASPSPDDVLSRLRLHYPRALAAFAALQAGEPRPARQQVMQYSAGLFRGREPVPVADDLRAQVERYPRVLGSWLYGNATGEVGPARELFALTPPRAQRWRARAGRGLDALLRVLGV